MQALVLELKHSSLFRKGSELTQMTLQDRTDYTNPVTKLLKH